MNGLLAIWVITGITILLVYILPKFFPGDNFIIRRLIIKIGVFLGFLSCISYILITK